MSRGERAERLARAIEDLVQGRQPPQLDDDELEELLQIARIRLDAGQAAARAGAHQERSIWEQVVSELEKIRHRKNGHSSAPPKATNLMTGDAPGKFDVQELQDIINLRRQIAEEATSLAEMHRDAVWQKVQARLQAGESETRGFFPFPFRRRNPQVETFAGALDRLVLGEPVWEANDSQLQELLQLAQARRAVAKAAITGTGDAQGRVWARLRPRLMARLLDGRRSRSLAPVFGGSAAAGAMPRGVGWPKLAAGAALAALVLVAFGPLPATGLAGHPLAVVVRFVGGHVGVSETTTPPTVPPPTEVVEALDVSVEQASELLGLPVREPTFLPEGFRQVSSRYYPQPLSAASGGVFLLAYELASGAGGAASPTLLIFQEQAGESAIAVEAGFVQDVVLPDGTAASYVEGSWRPAGSELVWGDRAAQTVVFDADGVRTVIAYIDGPKLDPTALLAVASGLASAGP